MAQRRLRANCRVCEGKRHQDVNFDEQSGTGTKTYWCENGCTMETLVTNKYDWLDSEWVPTTVAHVWAKLPRSTAFKAFYRAPTRMVDGIECYSKVDLIKILEQGLRQAAE